MGRSGKFMPLNIPNLLNLFHIAVWFLLVETIENTAITLILSKQETDIHSLWHMLGKREIRVVQSLLI